ncbi:MAG: AMP-binding protein, partial [Proteobacteria bacterium]|nr:AMP-binding protein [Pseudomonadota bacterium]
LVPHPDPLAIIELTQKHKPTLLAGPPAVYRSLLAQGTFRKVNLSPVKGFFAGAAPMPPGTIEELKSLRNVPVINVYGLTESCSMGTATPWGGTEKPGTAGVPLPGTDLQIVDGSTGTRQLSAGEPGEICFRGPQVMKGYCNKPAETAAVLKDGWLFTGDIGFVDEDGWLTILDRKEDLIVAGDRIIYPSEVDAAILTHPEVLEACTIGVPDEHGGVTLKGYVVLKPGQIVKAGEIIGHCRERLAPDKVPQSIEFIDALPKTATGKILRREVKEKAGK